MVHLIVADGHYYGATGEAERWGALLAAAADRGISELSILGDFFELWIGLPGLAAPWQEGLFEPVRRLKEYGVRTRYVIGTASATVRW